jgi:hypothetical protein
MCMLFEGTDTTSLKIPHFQQRVPMTDTPREPNGVRNKRNTTKNSVTVTEHEFNTILHHQFWFFGGKVSQDNSIKSSIQVPYSHKHLLQHFVCVRLHEVIHGELNDTHINSNPYKPVQLWSLVFP